MSKANDEIAKTPCRSTMPIRQKEWLRKLETVSGQPIASSSLHTVYLLIDCSGSMAGAAKMVAIKAGAAAFAADAGQKGYGVGIVMFASTANHLLAPSRSMDAIRQVLNRLRPDGSTDLAGGIRLTSVRMNSRGGERVMCIVTDGMPDNAKDALSAATDAKASGIDIMTIGTDDADENFLRALATRKELAIKVPREQLGQSLSAMTRMLPR